MPDPIAATSAPVVDDEKTPDGGEQVETVVETPTTEQPATETPGSDPSGAPSQPDPLAVLETIPNLDPKVKEVLKAGFMRQSDYTQKTQEIAEVRKAADAYKQWTPVISFLEKNPSIAQSLFGTTDPNKATEEELPDDPREFMKVVKKQATDEALAILRKEMTTNSDIEAASALDTRLNTDEGFAKQIAGIIEINFGDAVRKGEMSVTEATQRALEAHKKYEDSVRQSTVKEMTEKAKKKTMVIPSGNGSPLPTAAKTGKLSMSEAAKKAEEELASR